MALTITQPIAGTPEMEAVKRIWMEAFPPAERITSFETIQSVANSHINAYYDADRLVGFSILSDIGWFDYLLYFAIDSTCRSGGYGGQILDAILAEHTTRPLYFSVEDPDETPAENIEQRLKRVAFYEKHNCALSEVTFQENPRFRLMYYHSPERLPDVMAEMYRLYQQFSQQG